MTAPGWHDETLRYLRQAGFVRLWEAAKRKYEQLGRVGGTVRLTSLDASERQALEGLMAVNLHGMTETTVSLARLDQALRETKFALLLPDALKMLYPDLQTRQERNEESRLLWERFGDWALAQPRSERWRQWAAGLYEGQSAGSRALLECYDIFQQTGGCMEWEMALRALESLPLNTSLRLPVYAARVTGDPHALDRDRLSGRLFYYGLMDLNGQAATEELEETASQAEVIRQMYASQGLLLDDISSYVWAGGWVGLADDPMAVPLWTLDQMLAKGDIPHADEVWVVENPSVFGELMNKRVAEKIRYTPLVCTSGQPSLAALKLLDRVAATGGKINYAGDFDVKGLEMALQLQRRYTNRWFPWHLDAATYVEYVHPDAPFFNEAESQALSRLDLPWDGQLISVMLKYGRKLYQEQVKRLFE